MLYLQVNTGDGYERIFKSKGWIEMLRKKATVEKEHPQWDLIITGVNEICEKFAKMTRGQLISVWESLDLQHEASPETMTMPELEGYHYLKNNLWHLT
jgi:hypothetical protein